MIKRIANDLGIREYSVRNTLELSDGGATIPFISRYRKEMTGSLDEVQIAEIIDRQKYYLKLEDRKETILNAIEEQGKLTDSLRQKIRNTYSAIELEDIYLPYKKKKKTKGDIAKENGLEPLARIIMSQHESNIDGRANGFVNAKVKSVEEALQGAKDIIAEWVNESEASRNKIRRLFEKEAVIYSKLVRVKEEEAKKYKDYFDFHEPLKRCPAHRMLALRRGESENFLRVKIEPEEENAIFYLKRIFVKDMSTTEDLITDAILDSYKRLLKPAIETEFRKSSKEKADEESINVFATNLEQLLMAPPLGEKRIMGIDPGFRTGCKVVCLDETGNLLSNDTIFPHPPKNSKFESKESLLYLIDEYNVQAIAIGNGTAGQETYDFVKGLGFSGEVYLISESGASVYSASEKAREEFPNHDLTVRGAISIGRRLMDPLAELVKIDPKSIGVGQYQHDVNQTKLRESLDRTIEYCVNNVGVNINTASKYLLENISGLGSTTSQNLVEYRNKIGGFSARKEIKDVPGVGAKAFEQCAGFLRVLNGKNPLDNTAVHPESYSIVKSMARDIGCSVEELISSSKKRQKIRLEQYITDKVGMPTLKDILKELSKPGLDPRGQAKEFNFDKSFKSIEELLPGVVIPGIITNITNFGAFVDIGIKENGLVHISQIANRFVKNPADELTLGQEVKARVLDVDIKRKRINLSLKDI